MRPPPRPRIVTTLPVVFLVVGSIAFGWFASISSAQSTQSPSSPQTTVVKAGRLIDGRGGPPLEPAMVRLTGDRIEEVASSLAVPTGATLVDLGNATLLPGLIDLHTHLTDRDDVHWEAALTSTTPPEAALWGARNARVTLMAGFTTCRDMGPTWPYVDVELRKAIEAGAVPGPRMIVAGNYVSSTGGAGDARQFSIYLDVPIVRNLADGPEEVVKAVRTNFKNGADFIKILVTGAVLSKGIPPGAQQYSDAEIQAAVTEANRWGRPVAAHAHGADGIKAAIRAGVRTVDHGSYLDDEAVGMLKQSRRTFYVPTLALGPYIQESAHVPESEKARGRVVDEIAVGGFKRALAANLPIGLATDAPVMPHGLNAREIEYRVSLGEPAMHAIVAATSLNAEIIGMQDRIGSVVAGKLADLIAVPGNPLTTIGVLSEVRFVMKGGVIFKDELSARRLAAR
ncbi:MAG TPA: amidohydrolase family protein [Vicinamibacterales bacterium]|nr:amidohydrolase family protein [Vicinamibacterales bacterium]